MTITVDRRYRLGVAARAVAAIGGGYLLAAVASTLLGVLLAALLPLSRADAVSLATMLAFVIYPCAVLWVFATASAGRAWAGILGASALLGGVLWLTGGLS